MNIWGNEGRGPGGDPSWLGGKDRGAGQPGSGDGASGDAAWNGGGGSEQHSVYQSGSYQYGGYESGGSQSASDPDGGYQQPSYQNGGYQQHGHQLAGGRPAGHQPSPTRPASSQPAGTPSDFSSDFSSGFSSGGPRPTSDVDGSADEMSPEFGARAQHSAPRDARSDGPEWKSEFLEQTGLGTKKGKRSPLQMVIGMIFPIIVMIIFFTVISRMWGSGFHFPWFFLLFMLVPVITRLLRMFTNKD